MIPLNLYLCAFVLLLIYNKHVVHENAVDGSSMIGFPLVIAVSERDMPGIEPGPLGWHTSALTNELQEVRLFYGQTWLSQIFT